MHASPLHEMGKILSKTTLTVGSKHASTDNKHSQKPHI